MPAKNKRYRAHYHTFKRKRAPKLRKAARHPFAIPVATMTILLLITGGLFLFFNSTRGVVDPNVVLITDNKQQQIVSSKEPTVEKLLTKLDIDLNEGDVVEPALATAIQQDDFRINIYRAAPVEIVDNGQKAFAFSARTTGRSIATSAGIEIYPEDKLTMKPIRNFVETGGVSEMVIVERATPVNVNLYGAPVVMRTHAGTVGDLLKERKINLKPQDQVKPDVSTPIAAAGQVTIVRNGLSTIAVQEDIPMPVESLTDNTLTYGTSAIRQKGSPGKKAVVYEINTQNGVEVSRRPIQETIVQEPVKEIRVVGSNISGIKGDMARAGIAPSDYQYVDYIITKESRWNPTARNASSGAYGLCQALPGSKMANTALGGGPDWETNPVTQLRWCNGYATSRYGTWQAAYNFWLNNHWW